jgi:alanyl-tRNA synthetase
MEEQKKRARAARNDTQSMNKQSIDLMNCTVESTFTYGSKEISAKVLALFENGVKVDTISEKGEIILDQTIFYAESGGQVSDIGEIINEDFSSKVVSVIKAPNKQHLHRIEVLFGEIKVGDVVTLRIDEVRRNKIARNHSSVHLLQQALMEVVGDHIAQHGSYVTDEYSHFDFNHYEKITPEQIAEVERKVNEWIALDIACDTKVLPIAEANKLGAKALFDDKYGDTVRVVCFGDVSKEFCGGTHVTSTANIGLFVIEYEESVAAGIRRIQARTSSGAYEFLKRRDNSLNRIKDQVGVTNVNDIQNRINLIIKEKDELKKLNESLNDKLAYISSQSLKENFVEINGVNLLVNYSKGSKRDNLLSLIDNMKTVHDNYLLVFIGEENGNYPIVVASSKPAITKGLLAGKVVRAVATLLKGSGGGREELASGAGKDISQVNLVLDTVKGMIN